MKRDKRKHHTIQERADFSTLSRYPYIPFERFSPELHVDQNKGGGASRARRRLSISSSIAYLLALFRWNVG